MYCRKCGKQIPDDSNYCQHCGEKIINLPIDDSKATKEIMPPVDSWSLDAFANEFGKKMQIVKAANKAGELLRYAVFTKETRVEIDPQLNDVDAAYISQNKSSIRVDKMADKYVLFRVL